jgi:hydroxymethylpyrimidine pyrophosphatase-like HAD family hydrolase
VLEEPGRTDRIVAGLRRQFAGRIEVQAIFAPNYGVHIVEAFSAGATKFSALVYVGQGHGIGAGAMAAIGDDHNDLSMLRGVKLSAAPADAPPELLAAASMTLSARGQSPVAQFVERILDGQG